MPNLQNLTIGDLSLGLVDLFKTRLASLESVLVWKAYKPAIEESLRAIGALPELVTGKQPFAAELGEVDRYHDGYGGAVYYFVEAQLRLPDLAEETRAKLVKLRDDFVPTLGELQVSFAEEATRAKARRPALAEHKAFLESIPVMGGKSLYDWVAAFLDKGDELDALLSSRSLAVAKDFEKTRAGAGGLRAATIGLLGRFRTALADEVAGNPKLPRNVEALVFGYFDELARLRDAALRTAPKKTGEPAPTTDSTSS